MFSLPSIFSAIGSDDGVRQLLHALGSAEPPLRRGVVADVEVNHGPDVGGPSRVDLPRRARERTNGSRPSSRDNLACSACGRAICIWPHPGAVPIQLIPCTENILFRGGGGGGRIKHLPDSPVDPGDLPRRARLLPKLQICVLQPRGQLLQELGKEESGSPTLRRKPALRELHGWQDATTLSHVVPPPLQVSSAVVPPMKKIKT